MQPIRQFYLPNKTEPSPLKSANNLLSRHSDWTLELLLFPATGEHKITLHLCHLLSSPWCTY